MTQVTGLSGKSRLLSIVLTLVFTTVIAATTPTSTEAAPLTCGGKEVTISGTNGVDDPLNGTNGRDVIAGLGGHDVINGLEGKDVICGGNGNDEINGAEGDDLVRGDSGSDTVYGGTEDDRVLGQAGDDFLYGDYWGSGVIGNDVIDGGSNTAFGGDWLYFDIFSVTVNLEGGTAVGEGQDTLKNLENVYGSTQNDTLIGDDKPNYLVGSDGNDVIWGRDGNDVAHGGLGNDGLFGGGGVWDWVVYFEAPSSVQVDLETRVATGGAGTDELSGFELVVGSNHSDTLLGDARDNYLAGRGGDDTLNGRDGFDLASFYNSADANLETESSTNGPSPLTGVDLDPEGNDDLFNLEGLWGSPSVDILTGDSGPNLLRGAEGGDTLFGAGGSDYFLQDSGGDSVDGGPGNYDLADYFLFTGPVEANLASGDDTGGDLTNVEALLGSKFDDVLEGDGGDNNLFGLGGDDELKGFGGEDALAGGAGTDDLAGGGGDDKCTQWETKSSCESTGFPQLHPLVVVGNTVARAERRYK